MRILAYVFVGFTLLGTGLRGPVHAAGPSTLAFQGVLRDKTGQPVTSPAGGLPVTFSLYTAATGGAPVWSEAGGLLVADGRFAIHLGSAVPFPPGLAFDRPYWIGVKIGGDPEMTPRFPLQAVPYALNAWSVAGNTGTDPATHFLGTTDEKPLQLRSNNRRVGFLQDVTNVADTFRSVNVINGSQVNKVTEGVVGATIAGGGRDVVDAAQLDTPNEVWGDFGTISGGSGNFTDAFPYATIGGGTGNIVQGAYATVGGGSGNNPQGAYVTIGGGSANAAAGAYTVIAGGDRNSASNNTGYNTISGGGQNTVAGHYNTISGGYQNSTADYGTTVGGGVSNQATQLYATVAGGVLNRNTAQAATIAGGRENANSGWYASIGGGFQNSVNGMYASIGGGNKNVINGPFTTVAGGNGNYAWTTCDYGTIGGGSANTVYGDYATIPGGFKNYADGLASFAAGYRAYAAHDGSFVWADATEADFVSTAANQFCVRARGGLVFDAYNHLPIYTGVGTTEANRFVLLLNSPRAPSASGLKAGGILCSDDYGYASPGKNDMVVKGSVGIGYNFAPTNYKLGVNGQIYALGGYAGSDARYKKDIHPLEDAIGTVLSLRGVSFTWDRDAWKDINFPEGRQLGLIAQEVEKVLPEVVSTDPSGQKAVSYQSLVPLLVESVKALKEENDGLAARNRALEARLDDLARAVERLESARR